MILRSASADKAMVEADRRTNTGLLKSQESSGRDEAVLLNFV